MVVALLAVEGLLWLSDALQWFGFNTHKGWTVLIAVAGVGLVFVAMLLWLIVAIVFRLRFQFSIPSMLVLTVAVALPCSWLEVEMKSASEQKDLVDAIRKFDGFVAYDWQCDPSGDNGQVNAQPSGPQCLRKFLGDDFFASVVWLASNSNEISDEELAHLAELTQLRGFDLEGTQITDAGLAQLAGLKQLRSLYLPRTQITDAGLVYLAGLTQLQRLNLQSTKITDAGLVNVAALTQLQYLNLDNTQITDAGLTHLANLTQLQKLSLERTQITDTGLVGHISGLTQLRDLWLNKNPKITDAGVKRLQQALRNCGIRR